jgi:protease-4
MDEYGQQPQYKSGSYGSQPPRPIPHVVHVVARPGGFGRIVGMVFGLFAFGAVLFFGVALGMGIASLGSALEGYLLEHQYRSSGSKTVAIIPVEGMINEEQAEFVRAAVDQVLSDHRVVAVVLRVDSGGGGVSASDQIWSEVQRLKKYNLPVVASFGGLAASGGYYIACGADAIVAEETCITGSIGVIAQVLTFEGMLEKIGVEPVTLVAENSPEKDIANNIFRAWGEPDREKVRVILDAAYDVFRSRVAMGRAKTLSSAAALDAAANGSIFTASKALEAGLIDSIGYLDDAIADAERLAAIPVDSSNVIEIRRPMPILGSLLMGHHQTNASVADWLDADRVRALASELAMPRPMYLMH